jgi:uncharacterized protein with HEPN domain
MTQHDDSLRLRHMRDHGREALDLIQGIDRAAFDENRVLQLAIVRLLEIVGEAAARTPDTIKSENSQIPWRRISGLRNRLIHGYDTIDLGIVWSVLTGDLPVLLTQLDTIIGDSLDS